MQLLVQSFDDNLVILTDLTHHHGDEVDVARAFDKAAQRQRTVQRQRVDAFRKCFVQGIDIGAEQRVQPFGSDEGLTITGS